jgi:hypothetical protein
MGSNSTTLGEAQIPIRATMEKLDSDLSAVKSKVGSAVSAIGLNLNTIGTTAIAGIGAAMGVITGGILAISKFTIDATPIEGVQKAFEGITASAGTSGDEMLAALQKGSYGLIQNEDLMKSYNQAAQLVGTEFANQLPDAMKYLSKVSSATGQDMSFMMDSLVKGVGRLSPMILDNLGIQVSLTEATAKASEMYGVQESALSKAQIQAGMMNVTLEKLAINTESMPEVTEQAAAKMSQYKTKIQNAKDTIGLAFLPVLGTMSDMFSGLADNVMPKVQAMLDVVAPKVEMIAKAVSDFVLSLANGEDPINSFRTLIKEIFPEEVAEKINTFVDKFKTFCDQVKEVLDPVMTWIGKNVQLQDVLIALGIAIATVVVPAIWSVITAIAPVIGVFLLVAAVITALRLIWENDFLGIRTALTDAWENSIKPALEELWNWLSVNIPMAIETVKAWFEGSFLPALQLVWNFISTYVIPVFQTIGNLLGVVIGGAISVLAALWQNVLLPAITVVWAFLQQYVFPLFQALGEFIGAVMLVMMTAWAGLWQNVLYPAIVKVASYLSEKLKPAFDAIIDLVSQFRDWLSGKLRPALDGIGRAISSVTDFIGKMVEAIRAIRLPDWLTPGSPTPFEIGLWGIGDALKSLNTMHLPKFAANLEISETGMLTSGELGQAGASSDSGISMADLQLALDRQAKYMASAMSTAIAQRIS